jgi:hypothetical protein
LLTAAKQQKRKKKEITLLNLEILANICTDKDKLTA